MLASAQKIIALTPIEGADFVEVCQILGWEVVVRKGDYKVGQLVGYVSIDTILPDLPEYEFMRERKFRVRSIKIRKICSQGLIVPLPSGNWREGDDLTKVLNIKKYEKPDNNPIELYEKVRVPKIWYKKLIHQFKFNYLYKWFPFLQQKLRSPFPTHLVPITDEQRIQNIPQKLTEYAGEEFILSYKLDGSSITIIHERPFFKSKFRICSRRFELHDKKNDWYKVFTATNFKDEILKLVKHFNTNDIIVQGEAIGRFNGNHHNLQSDQIRLFNIYVNGKRIKQDEFIEVCLANNIPHCPMYKRLTLNHSLADVLKMSEIKDVLNPSVDVEGLVWRATRDGLSFKAINNNYLLKNKE